MTRDEVKKLFPIIEAYVDGKIIQYFEDGEWCDFADDFQLVQSYFSSLRYRIKPELKKVRMSYGDFNGITDLWVRYCHAIGNDFRILSITCVELIFINGHKKIEFISYEKAYEDSLWQWSTDRVNWQTFEKEVQE
jgi:hypothetical protein